MATPVPDAPFVLPSVVFRPGLLALLCLAAGALAVGLAALAGAVMFGLFFCLGLALGLGNALLVRHSVTSITAEEHPVKRRMALNSFTRLMIITVVSLVIAYVFRPTGLGVLFGLALFQVILVISTVLPVWRKIRSGEAEGGVPASAEQAAAPSLSERSAD